MGSSFIRLSGTGPVLNDSSAAATRPRLAGARNRLSRTFLPLLPRPQPAPSSAGRRGVGERRAGEPGLGGPRPFNSVWTRQTQGHPFKPRPPPTFFPVASSGPLFGYPQPPGHANTMCLSLTPCYRSAVSPGHLGISALRRRPSPAAWPTGVCGPPSPLSLGLCFRHEGHGSGEPGTLFSGRWLRRGPRASLS